MGRMLETLDHPLPFLFFMFLAIFAMRAVAVSIAKKQGWDGIAAFFGH